MTLTKLLDGAYDVIEDAEAFTPFTRQSPAVDWACAANSWRHRSITEIDSFELAELAWGIIANAFGGDWQRAPMEWIVAAQTWRDDFFLFWEFEMRVPVPAARLATEPYVFDGPGDEPPEPPMPPEPPLPPGDPVAEKSFTLVGRGCDLALLGDPEGFGGTDVPAPDVWPGSGLDLGIHDDHSVLFTRSPKFPFPFSVMPLDGDPPVIEPPDLELDSIARDRDAFKERLETIYLQLHPSYPGPIRIEGKISELLEERNRMRDELFDQLVENAFSNDDERKKLAVRAARALGINV